MWLLAQFPQNAPNAGAFIGGMVCGLIIGVAIGTLIGAVILRAACWLYNKLVGGADSPSAVPEPDFNKAVIICFVAALVQFGLGMVLGLAGVAAQLGPTMVNCISVPLSFLVTAAMLSAMLPTTFPRALLVALLQFVVIIVIVLVLFMVAMMLGVGLAVMHR